jgi:hypothetical protein
MLRASFGTTKFCTFFLRGSECSNPDCLYLHSVGDDVDCFTLDQMQDKKRYFKEYTHPGPGPRPQFPLEGSTKLPPPARHEPLKRQVSSSDNTERAPRPVTEGSTPGAKVWAPGTGVAIIKAVGTTASAPPSTPLTVSDDTATGEMFPALESTIAKGTSLAPSVSSSSAKEAKAPPASFPVALAPTSPPAPLPTSLNNKPSNPIAPPPGIIPPTTSSYNDSAAASSAAIAQPTNQPQNASTNVNSSTTMAATAQDIDNRARGFPAAAVGHAPSQTEWVNGLDDSKIDDLFSALPSNGDSNYGVDPVMRLAAVLGLKLAAGVGNTTSRKQSRFHFASGAASNVQSKSNSSSGSNVYIWSSPSSLVEVPVPPAAGTPSTTNNTATDKPSSLPINTEVAGSVSAPVVNRVEEERDPMSAKKGKRNDRVVKKREVQALERPEGEKDVRVVKMKHSTFRKIE